MERKKSAPAKPPMNPMQIVISDQAISDSVMIHLREKRSPMKPATTVIAASVHDSSVLIHPICTSVRFSSSWIGIVRSPKRALSA